LLTEDVAATIFRPFAEAVFFHYLAATHPNRVAECVTSGETF
jgi:hypothetical protein